MKKIAVAFLVSIILVACKNNSEKKETISLPVVGTWQLISGTIIEKGDTTVTNYDKGVSFIKIINDSHFAFLSHDLSKGKDSINKSYSSGGGKYSLSDSTYTEHLEYCTAREWEGNDFTFTITIHNDTLIQTGVEKIESEGINRLNIEKYFRLKN